MERLKKASIFVILWIITTIIVTQICNFFAEEMLSAKTLRSLALSKEEFQNLIYNNAVLSFLLAYICGKLYMQKKPENKQYKKIIYLLCYLLSFSLLFILIVSII